MAHLDRGVAVVGAGYAGMAAAATLARRDVPVTVYEAAPVPGGRARCVRAQGVELDNGLHILVGAYSQLLELMKTVGVPDNALLRLPLEVRTPNEFHFRSLWLPAPFGLLAGLLAARGVSLAERLGAVRFMAKMRRRRFRLARDQRVSEMLAEHRQNGPLGRYLWQPLCTAALNTAPEQASANAFLAVLRDTLSGRPEASDLLLPRVDLSRLFPEPAADFVRARGGTIRLQTRVQDLQALRRDHAAVIVAVAPHHVEALLPGIVRDYTYQPIYTCYLQYSEHVRLPFPLLSLTEGLVQWVADCDSLAGARGRLACVISAEGDHQRMTREELAATCERELREALPGLPPLLWWRIIAEKRATCTCLPGLARPGPDTPLPRVYLAGDYTHPEYPPTLEGAVRSGVRAAERTLAG
jgi:hydroxysqualene dehydroxylase